MKQLFFSNKGLLLILTFILAFSVRLYFIYSLPNQDKFIDLCIYRDGGQLVSRGINPYKHSDAIEVRSELRIDTVAYNAYLSETQKKWDFYASSNLPLTLLYFGVIEKISTGSAFWYRIVFAFFDSLLSVLLVLILIKYWALKKSILNFIMILGIGALSPTLLLWGTILPEDKGLQIFFMLLAFYFAKEKKWILSAVFIGCSIAFKGLGVFIFPICLFFILDEPQNIFKIDRRLIIKGAYYTMLSLVFACVWFIPYIPDVIYMMQIRLNTNIGGKPQHESIWIFFKNLPHFILYKNVIISIITFLWSYQFIFKKINVAAISAFILVLFVDILLLEGGLDRMNIGIIVSIVVFGLINIRFAKILGWYTILAGIILFNSRPVMYSYDVQLDALYVLGYVLIFSLYPLFHFKYFNNVASYLNEKFIRISDGFKIKLFIAFLIIAFTFQIENRSNFRIIVNKDVVKTFKDFGIIDKTGSDILWDVGMGKTNPENIKLNATQYQEIKKLILSDPNNYNELQKSLLKKH